MGGRWAPVLLAAGLLLGACTSGTAGRAGSSPLPSSAPSSPSSSPSLASPSSTPPAPAATEVPADVPTAGPNLLSKGERPPVMPLLATTRSRAGGVAFAKFFVATIDWAYATTSTRYMRHYYVKGCTTCESIDIAISRQAGQGHHFVGDRLTVTGISRVAADLPGVQMDIDIAASAVKVVDRAGRVVDSSPALTIRDHIFVFWVDGHWTVQRLTPES